MVYRQNYLYETKCVLIKKGKKKYPLPPPTPPVPETSLEKKTKSNSTL